jgi:hypothetical protein
LLAHEIKTSFDAIQVGIQESHEYRLLGGEVMVESALAYPGGLANFGYARGVVTRFREQVGGGFKDVVACFFTAVLHVFPLMNYIYRPVGMILDEKLMFVNVNMKKNPDN